jgi:hypothetical protein
LQEGADWIVFASGMAIEHFHERFDLPGLMARFPRLRLAITTPTIQWALDELGLKASVISRPNDAGSLADGIAGFREPSLPVRLTPFPREAGGVSTRADSANNGRDHFETRERKPNQFRPGRRGVLAGIGRQKTTHRKQP